MISRAGAPVYVDYAHTPDALEAAIEALRPHVEGQADHRLRRRRRPRHRASARRMGAVAARLARRGHRHRRQSAQRGSGRDPRGGAGRALRRNRDRRPPRGDRRGDRHGGPGRHHPARRQGPRDRARSSANRCFPFDDAKWRGNARRDGALWTTAEIEAATGGTASAPFEVAGVTFDSREVGPGDLFVAMPGTVADGHEFVAQAFAAGAAGGAGVASRSTARMSWSPMSPRR